MDTDDALNFLLILARLTRILVNQSSMKGLSMNGRNVTDNLLQLPAEMLEHIFSNLDVRSMLNAQRTCASLYNQFAFWGKAPIPNRDVYLAENINRAARLLSIAVESNLHVLLLGSRSMQANVISRPRFLFGETILPFELDEDFVKLPEYKLRIFSSLNDGLSHIDIMEQIKQSHVLILCAISKDDYKGKLKILKERLDCLGVRPILFIAIPSNTFFETPECPAEKVIALGPEVKRDGVARFVMERLILLASERQKEMKALIKMS